ncbi:MAG: hypothetical protein AB1558_04355 [Thermodesulfobacteriota bacterium]
MGMSSSLHKGKASLILVYFIAFAAFAADILDLREELYIVSSQYSHQDSDVSAGIVGGVGLQSAPDFVACAVQQKTSVRISFLHLLPFGFRAPPSGHS